MSSIMSSLSMACVGDQLMSCHPSCQVQAWFDSMIVAKEPSSEQLCSISKRRRMCQECMQQTHSSHACLQGPCMYRPSVAAGHLHQPCLSCITCTCVESTFRFHLEPVLTSAVCLLHKCMRINKVFSSTCQSLNSASTLCVVNIATIGKEDAFAPHPTMLACPACCVRPSCFNTYRTH